MQTKVVNLGRIWNDDLKVLESISNQADSAFVIGIQLTLQFSLSQLITVTNEVT